MATYNILIIYSKGYIIQYIAVIKCIHIINNYNTSNYNNNNQISYQDFINTNYVPTKWPLDHDYKNRDKTDEIPE